MKMQMKDFELCIKSCEYFISKGRDNNLEFLSDPYIQAHILKNVFELIVKK